MNHLNKAATLCHNNLVDPIQPEDAVDRNVDPPLQRKSEDENSQGARNTSQDGPVMCQYSDQQLGPGRHRFRPAYRYAEYHRELVMDKLTET